MSKISKSAAINHCLFTALLFVLSFPALPQDSLPQLDLDLPLRMDFSGSWEKDFNRSDNWQDELSRTLRIRQEIVARQQSSSGSARIQPHSTPPIPVGNINLSQSRGRGANIVDLARLAEYISRHNTIKITQIREEVRIERQGEAALVCGTDHNIQQTFASEHGIEMCAWDGQQLIFQIMLPGNLTISHRFTVSSDNQVLNMLTSVYSKNREPFNLIQAFNRYHAPADEFNCMQTLSRGKVCNQSGNDLSTMLNK